MVLAGNYPFGPDSRLISPEIEVPLVGAGEEAVLRFQQYWTYQSSDSASVQISVFENDAWSTWETLMTMNQHSPVWHQARVDLTMYAGQRVRIGFFPCGRVRGPEFVRWHAPLREQRLVSG